MPSAPKKTDAAVETAVAETAEAKKVTIGDKGPQHRATFSADEYTGGFKIRIAGPTPNKFAGKIVPVHRKDGSVTDIRLGKLAIYDETWRDEATDQHVALYEMVKERRRVDEEVPF